MLSLEAITIKIEQLEREAEALGELNGAPFRELAMQWRLLRVQAVFMETVRRNLAGDDMNPDPEG